MSGLTEESWILIFTSMFNLLGYVTLVEVYVKIYPHIDMYIEKGNLILITFQRIMDILLPFYSKSTSSNFLQISCSVKSDIINELFIFCYTKTHWYILHFEWIFYSCMIL